MYRTHTPYTELCATHAIRRRERGFLNRHGERSYHAKGSRSRPLREPSKVHTDSIMHGRDKIFAFTMRGIKHNA